MMPLRKITFVLEDFVVGAAGQQLLDRFLIGYARDGEFRRTPELKVAAWLQPAAENSTAFADATRALVQRHRDFALMQQDELRLALNETDAVVVAASADRAWVGEDLIRTVLEQAPAGVGCFVHGAIAANRPSAEQITALAARRGITLASATSVATTFRLPEIDLPTDTALTDALVVAHGPRPLAELSAIDGLLPMIARRHGGESGVKTIRRIEGRSVWRSGSNSDWPWPLLAAAISRSNTTQGDPVRDGRTQDIVSLGLLKKLVTEPRGWIIDHRDGLRSTILILNGAVADINLAVRSRDGVIVSTQLYRPPAPNRSEFDRLAAVIDDFLTSRNPPWPIERSLVVAQLLQSIVT